MMELYKYCDWHRVREEGIILLSVLQKRTGDYYETSKCYF